MTYFSGLQYQNGCEWSKYGRQILELFNKVCLHFATCIHINSLTYKNVLIKENVNAYHFLLCENLRLAYGIGKICF